MCVVLVDLTRVRFAVLSKAVLVMRNEHLEYLACPECIGDLTLSPGATIVGDRIQHGELICARCDRQFAVERFIPRFVPAENYAAGFGFQWTVHAGTQCDSRNGTTVSQTRFFEETGWPRSLPGETVLEVGSGSGRFTEQAASTGAMIVSVDYSEAVDANYALNRERNNVLIVQGDIYALPLRPGSFDRAFCFGVLQHTPDVERAFMTLTDYVRPGGMLAIDVYRLRRGFTRLTMTHRWIRPLTRKMSPRRLYGFTRNYVRLMWPVSRLIHRIPRIGKKLNWMLLLADYRDVLDLPEDMLREWAILDTFDMLNPRYEYPQTIETVREWFKRAGLEQVDIRHGYNGIEGRAVKP